MYQKVALILCIFAIFIAFDATRLQSITLKLFNTVLSIWQNEEHKVTIPPNVYHVVSSKDDFKFTKDELAKYDGSPNSLGLYLGILGRVYDVRAGEKHYGPGGGYSFFAGKDGTKAFMTGEFNEKGLIDETTGLSHAQMLELENWIKFYDTTYTYKGMVIGNFYDHEGNPTRALHKALDGLKAAYEEKKQKDAEKKRFPPCNAQSKKGVYRQVSCSEMSGGIKRNWVGFPRQFFSSGSKKPRCVCVHERDLNHPQLKQYENCQEKATLCSLPPL